MSLVRHLPAKYPYFAIRRHMSVQGCKAPIRSSKSKLEKKPTSECARVDLDAAGTCDVGKCIAEVINMK